MNASPSGDPPDAAQRSALLHRQLAEGILALSLCRDEAEVFKAALEWVQAIYPAPHWAIGDVEIGQKQVVIQAFTPELARHFGRSMLGMKFPILGREFSVQLYEKGRVAFVGDAPKHPDSVHPEFVTAFSIKSLLGIPLLFEDRVVGAIFCTSFLEEPGLVRNEDAFDALHTLARVTAIALQRLSARKSLEQREHRYRTLFDHSIEAVLILDEARYLMANRAACQMFGYTEEEIRGQVPGFFSPEFQPDGQRSSDLAWAYSARSLEEGPQCFPWHHLGAGGRPLETEVTLAPFREGGQTFFQVIVRDMTEVNRAKAENKALENQLFQAQKLESLGVLAGGIAHDFNNILMGIMGHAGVALEFGNPEPDVKKHLEAILQSGQRAADLTRQMLAYSGRGHFVIHVVDLSQQVAELVSLLEVSIPKSVLLDFHLASDPVWISADAAQLQQVIMNLVINGAEAIGEAEGRITLTTAMKNLGPPELAFLLEGTGIEPGAYAMLEVADTGEGMNEETLNRIFEPFFTTKFTGRGLGLSAILGIVRGHRGGLAVESRPGFGTSFRIYFPPALGGPPEVVEVPEKASQPHRRLKVLVVDDESAVRSVACQILKAYGYEVEEAADGVEGLEKLKLLGPEIALVLLDMTMPRLGGEDTFRQMKALRPELPVILSSGYDEQEATRNFLSKGLAGFLQKPYRPRELLELIRSALGE